MQIEAQSKRASMSVGEFAGFTPYATPGFGGVSAVWRAQVGTEWHQRIQAESQAADDGFQNEVPIAGVIEWRGWSLELSGRIDQLKPAPDGIHLREIKTLSEPLPLERERILERYPSYPLQLLTYRELLLRNKQSKPFSLALLFVEIGSGLTQSVAIDASYDGLLAAHLDMLVDSLEDRQERLLRLRSLQVRPAYAVPRPGQETIQADLDKAFSQSPITLLEAPTGYGKTGVAWEYAVRQLANGQADRILYLTSKSTGQTEAVNRLRSLLSASAEDGQVESAPASFWHIRNKQEHCINHEFRCSPRVCPYLVDLHQKWKQGGLQRLYLLSNDEVSLETLKQEGRSTGICPYEVMRAGLGKRDIWIGDYNYLFSPNSASLLEGQGDFDPSRTFLIIDEAHNLPSRVESSFSFELDCLALYAAADDLRACNASRSFALLVKSLATIISSEPASPKRTEQSALSSLTRDDVFDHLLRIREALGSEPLPYDELQAETSDLLFTLTALQSAHQNGELEHLLWIPRDGTLRLECIDASQLIRRRLEPYHAALCLSATLSPTDSYLRDIGLPDASVSHLTPPAPWRQAAYDVAIDLRVDTRYRMRDRSISTTAATIAQAADSRAPVIVFFPSFAYAEKASQEMQAQHPFIRFAVQPRGGGSLADRNAFLEEAIAFNDALFLILGSSYSEGVDSLGGKAGMAIVVSPALPEMNLIQETKRKRYDSTERKGFERAYLQPGIQKVNQALGRLVRSPEHSTKVLLHCERFAEPKTKQLLDKLYQSKRFIQSDEAFDDWLNSTALSDGRP